MNTEFVFLNLTKDQLAELHRAYLNRYLMQETMRREQGLEPTEYPALLAHLEQLLGLSDEETHELLHRTEDELWQHSWYAYTDEWAWFRAKQDVLKALGKEGAHLPTKVMDEKIESAYQEHFERYVAEVDMHVELKQTSKSKDQKSKSKRKK